MPDQTAVAGPRRRLPRTRGATGGVLLIVLGAWGGLAPFIGPYYNFGFTPDDEWRWTAARGWLEVLPGGVALLGGLLLVVSASRATTVAGSVLGIVGGAWFVIGMPLAGPLRLGSVGQPLGTDETQQAMEVLALFTGLGALIIIVAASAFGRLSVVTVRDADAATRRERVAAEATAAEQAAVEEAAQRENAERESAERQAAELEATQRAQAEREQAQREQAHREQAERAQAEREQAERESAERESAAPAAAAGVAGIAAATNEPEPAHEAYQPPADPESSRQAYPPPAGVAADEPTSSMTSDVRDRGDAPASETRTDAAAWSAGEQSPARSDQSDQQPVWHSSTAAYLPPEPTVTDDEASNPPPAEHAPSEGDPTQHAYAEPAEPEFAEPEVPEPGSSDTAAPTDTASAEPDYSESAPAGTVRHSTHYEPGQYDLSHYRNRRYGAGPVDQDQVEHEHNE